MVLVPDGIALEIEAILLNKDMGFVREGQDVRVKLEALPFTKYGTLRGTVLTISNAAIAVGAEGSGKRNFAGCRWISGLPRADSI